MKMRPIAQMKDMLSIPDTGNDFDVYVTIGGQDITVIPSSEIRHTFEYSFYEWCMFTRGDTDSEHYAYLILCFSDYCKEMQMSFNNIYKALTAQYDPAANYSRDEQQSHKNERTTEYGKTATNTTTDLTSETEYNSTIADDTTTYNQTAQLRPATSQSKTGTDTTTLNGTNTTELTGSDTITDVGLLADNVRKVTGLQRAAASENIRNEIDMRIHNNFFDIVMTGFVERYLFLLTGWC